jgi:hypothetical protein
MTFEGCKCAVCKCAAIGLGCWCVVAAAPHDQFCEQQHRPTYCNLAWDLPHGPHNNHQPPINWVRSLTTVASSTSSSTSAMLNPDFFFKPPG